MVSLLRGDDGVKTHHEPSVPEQSFSCCAAQESGSALFSARPFRVSSNPRRCSESLFNSPDDKLAVDPPPPVCAGDLATYTEAVWC
ncbi:hypothetical protein NHX12_010667 [Muraenolepis orangiensis]|uniref:Uncharacterized protein n=1 Tax=Muraenolepis orangiensis TaxID=630683 RepID=A0A9Q0IAP1_9TELE|nr:hypothetical protein NHX12_010667 [Muraenolepis orangiensis]